MVHKNNFSYFQNGIKNTIPNDIIDLNQFLELIKKDSSLLKQIRDCADKKERDKLKSKLDYVTFNGIFSKRKNESLKEPSGLICLDYDDIENPSELKKELSKDEYTHSVFFSPSGKGLKLIVKIPIFKNEDEFLGYWVSIKEHYKINVDTGTKDVSRACYLTFDENPFFNPNSKIYKKCSARIWERIEELIKGKDTSRSGLEYRRAIAEFRKGKNRAEVEKLLMAYKKFADSSEQYQQRTLDNAEDFYLQEIEKTTLNIQPPSKEVLNILKNPDLFNLLIQELNKKIEGEEKSKKAILLSLCSVWNMDSEVPLNTFVSSESSAGKSFICKNIIKLFPKEMVVYRTKITPEAFTYWKNDEDWDWNGKICYLEDITQGILDAPTFKVMCSEGSIATIVIKQKAVDIEIQGKPVMLVTTARTNPNTEILNRFQIVSLDESQEQTRAIVYRQAKQKNTENYDEKIINSIKFLKRRKIYIPYAEKIANFLNQNYNFESVRLRRDFSRLLDLIKCSAVLHQMQRKENERGEIIANEQDYRIAREVINYIQTATFKGLTHKLKKAFDCCKVLYEFSAKDIYSHFPFVNQKMWYIYLDDLAERGMLTTILKKTEESKSRVTFYRINEGKVLSLPEFKKLPQNITNLTIVTNDTNVTNLTNVKNDCNKCNDYIRKPYTKIDDSIDFSKSGIKEAFENE